MVQELAKIKADYTSGSLLTGDVSAPIAMIT